MLTTSEISATAKKIRQITPACGDYSDQLAALQEITSNANASLDLDTVLRVGIEKALKFTGAEAGAIQLIGSTTNQLGPGMESASSQHYADEIKKSFEYGGYASQALLSGKVGVVSGIAHQEGDNLRVEFESLTWVPLKVQDRTVGILCLGTKSSRLFRSDEVTFFERIGAELGNAVNNALKFQQMRSSKEEAEKALRLKSDFLGTMSHELRTPLHVIMSNTALLLEGMCGDLNDAQRRRLKLIERNADDLLRLIQGILDITRLEESKMPLHAEEISVEGMLMELRSEFADLSRSKEVALEVRRAGSIPAMLVDRVKLKEILQNLMSNALKFTARGTVELQARYFDEKDMIEFVVQDTGIGIREEDLPHIFDVFYQVESTNHREFGGTGLGLNIVKRLVKLLQGEIRAESVWGKGSTFYVSMPREISVSRTIPGHAIRAVVSNERNADASLRSTDISAEGRYPILGTSNE